MDRGLLGIELDISSHFHCTSLLHQWLRYWTMSRSIAVSETVHLYACQFGRLDAVYRNPLC